MADLSLLGAHAILLVLSRGGSPFNGRHYCSNMKISDTQKFVIIQKFEQCGLIYRKVMHQKDADGMANRVDPD